MNIAEHIIEDTFREKFMFPPGQPADMVRRAMLLTFSRFVSGDKDQDIHLLIDAENRYIGVYEIIDGFIKPLCYHDSCWSTDGLHRFFRQYSESNLHIYTGFRLRRHIENFNDLLDKKYEIWYADVLPNEEFRTRLRLARQARYG